jgi:DNA-binding CsgD family transcriptional regulator
MSRRRTNERENRLTDAERELLHLVALGHTNREIGLRIGRTSTAVKALLQRMYRRFWVPNRAALVAVLRSRY